MKLASITCRFPRLMKRASQNLLNRTHRRLRLNLLRERRDDTVVWYLLRVHWLRFIAPPLHVLYRYP